MSATSAPTGRGSDRGAYERPAVASDSVRRLSTETKAAFKTTEFMAYLAVLVGIFIAGAVTSGAASSWERDPHGVLNQLAGRATRS
jgi:hypothetical protein